MGTSFLNTLSQNVWIYSMLKFYDFARATIGTSALVLAIEIVGNAAVTRPSPTLNKQATVTLRPMASYHCTVWMRRRQTTMN